MITKVVIPVLVFFAFSNVAIATSFSCDSGSLNESEMLICSAPGLGLMDDLLSDIYNKKLHVGDVEEKNLQRKWLRDRNKCKSDYGCIARAYRTRIMYLANKLGFQNPDSVDSPELFTTLHWISDSDYRNPTSCKKFEDINFDNKPEMMCIPDCGGPACSWYFFSSNNEKYIYFSELEIGSYGHLEIVLENQVPDYVINKYPNLQVNVLNGWYLLAKHYSYQGTLSTNYYCSLNGRYNKC